MSSCLRNIRKTTKKELSAVKDLLPSVVVKTVTIDFKQQCGVLFPLVFPGVAILGCCFHWTQAVWRKVQELGLQVAYNSDDKTHKYIKKLLALPYIPV